MPLYDAVFSENSYGFRPERSTADAVKKCLDYFNCGLVWVVDMDLEKFFDTVSREKLMQILTRDIHDYRVLSLIAAYVHSGAVDDGKPVFTSAGIPQGGPLSPLLANVMLNELDSELSRRREYFVRYADYMMIFCRSKSSAQQALRHITPFIKEDLSLRLNDDKTAITHADNVNFLGYGFLQTPNGYRLRVHEDSIARMRDRVAGLIGKRYDAGNIINYLSSWTAHYRQAVSPK